jgi:hypothetical protein
MVRCLKCGRENDEGMRFCTNCGTPITQSPAGGPPGYDPSTSETISFNAPPQTTMGMGTPTSPYTSSPPFTQSAPKSRTGMIVGIVVGALLLGLVALGAAGAYFYYSNQKEPVVVNDNRPRNTNGPDSKPTPEASPETSPSPSSKPGFEPPTEATREGSFTVYANEGWQLSDIAVVPREQYTSRVEGIVDISGVKTGINATGVKDEKFKSRRLFPEFPVGALLMRTRYADGKFSNMVATHINGNWENLPDERGMLEFIINDNAPQDNGGQFTIKVKMTKVPKK